jgi:hypothetical protein
LTCHQEQRLGEPLVYTPRLDNSIHRYSLSATSNAVILWSPVLIVGLFSGLFWFSETRKFAIWLVEENRPVEWMQFGAFLLTAVYALRISIRFGRQAGWIFYFYLFIAFGGLIVALEEISWGQWIFFFEFPEFVKAIN